MFDHPASYPTQGRARLTSGAFLFTKGYTGQEDRKSVKAKKNGDPDSEETAEVEEEEI
jgi:hypothetical protein